MAMKAIILILLWGFVQGQSSSCELAHPHTCERLSSLESSFESFCHNFNSLRSNQVHRETICALDNIRCQLVDQGILPNQYPLSVAQERCADPLKRFDPECAYALFFKITMSNPFFIRVREDTIRAVYVDIWLLHPLLRSRCGAVLNQESNDAKSRLAAGLSEVRRGENPYAKVLYGRDGQFLREGIEASCVNNPLADQIFCPALPQLVKLVNTLEMVKWEFERSFKWSAYRLHFLMLKHIYPEEFETVYPTTTEQVSELIVNNLEKIFGYINNGQIDDLTGEWIPLVPDLTTIKSRCETAWALPSNVKKSECMFWKAIVQLEAFSKSRLSPASGKVIKMLNTNIDYKSFLALTEMDRILQVVENQETALQELSQWVTSEVSKTVNERFNGLRTYFTKVETFNREKANADVEFINGRLNKYKSNIETLSTELGNQVGKLIDYAIAAVSLELAEDAAQCVLAAAVVMNPLEKLFGGSSAGDYIDRQAKLADTLTLVGEMIGRERVFNELVNDAKDIRRRLNNNAQFLEDVRVILDGIQKGTSADDFASIKQKFLDDYKAYDPQVEKPELSAMTGKWEEMIEGTCQVILECTTNLCAGPKAIVRRQVLCPKAKAKAQEMIATYEEIYDFQFELIESMATYMRAAVSLDAASSITGDYDALTSEAEVDANAVNDLKTLTIVSYISYKINIWRIVEDYCNILEYQRGGTRPSVCNGVNTEIASLASFVIPPCREVHDYREVPIASNGNLAFMSLGDLYAGKPVTFQIPDSQWLVDNGWINPGDQNAAIFVKQFVVFLPTVSPTEREVRVEAKVSGENQHSPPDGTRYVIVRVPEKKFIFYYREGHSAVCRRDSDKLTNPYGSSLPKICPLNEDQNSCQELLERTPLFPSVYSKWKVSISGYESVQVPEPASNFKLKVDTKLCFMERPSKDKGKKNKFKRKKKLILTKRKKTKYRHGPTNCPDGHFWSGDSGVCSKCPKGSRSALHGYYCEKIPKKN